MVYSTSIIRAGDNISWQESQNILFMMYGEIGESINSQRQPDDLRATATNILDRMDPIFNFSMAGRFSKNSDFCDQEKWLQFILSNPHWPQYGMESVTHLPRAFAFIYHSMHGALCAKTSQLQTAVDGMFSRRYSISGYRGGFEYLYHLNACLGIGVDPVLDWQFLLDMCQRWKWLTDFYFFSPKEYQGMVTAYYLTLSITEFIVSGGTVTDQDFYPTIYPHFIRVSNDIAEQVTIHIVNNKLLFESLMANHNVTKDMFRDNWKKWLGVCYHIRPEYHMFRGEAENTPYASIIDALCR